jgi:hypothetical protein
MLCSIEFLDGEERLTVRVENETFPIPTARD